MPTATFFRLPEEKRQRLLDAAWEEFTRSRYTSASINRIIHDAHIPRGSFYQYFVDKYDLFYFLLEGVRQHFTQVLSQMLQDAEGDMFQLPARAFDRFVQRDRNSGDCYFKRCLSVLRNNLGMDLQKLMLGRRPCLTEQQLEHIDVLQLKRQDPVFVDCIFRLLLMSTGSAIMETLSDPEQWQAQRKILEEQVEIIKYGACLSEKSVNYKEVTAC